MNNMSTIDLTKVAGFKAVDAECNDMGIVSLSEMTNMVKESIIQEAVAMQSVSTLAETSTLAATDTYEDRLQTSDTFSHVRTLDANGNPRRTSSQAFATVEGGLLPDATILRSGLMTSRHAQMLGSGFVINAGSGHKGKYVKLFTINNYNGTIATVEMCSYGDSSSFVLEISLGAGIQSAITYRNGKILLGSLSGFKLYVVDLSIYMFVPDSIKDCYVYISNRQGIVHDGTDIFDSIDTSVEVSIS